MEIHNRLKQTNWKLSSSYLFFDQLMTIIFFSRITRSECVTKIMRTVKQ
jgi:general stress protein CsbA